MVATRPRTDSKISRGDSKVEDLNDDKNATDEKELSKQKVPLSKLFRYTTIWERCLLFVGAFVSIATGAGLPLMSILQGRVSQAFINEQKFLMGVPVYADSNGTYDQKEFTDAVYAVVYNYIYLSVGVFLAANIQVTCFLIVCENMTNRLRRLFVRAILRQEIAWFDKNNSGKLAIQLFDNLERVKEGTGDKMGLMIQYIAQFITGLIIAFCHDWKLTLIMLAITPLQAFFGFMISKTMGQYTVIESIRYSKAGAVAEEVLSSIRTVVAFNGVERKIQRFTAALQSAREMGMRRNMLVGLSFGGIGLVNYSGFALAFYIGISWVYDGAMQPGDLLTVFFAVMMGSVALGQAGPQAAVLGTAQGAAVSIFEVLDREPEIDSSSVEGVRDVTVKGAIELKNVAFRYPSRPEVQVLNGLSLRVEPGEKVALVGASGCGKSTVVGLLLRYYDAEGGQILIDGRPLSSLNVEFLRQQIAVVSQEPILFNCSIEENIRYGNEELTQEQMEAACKMANAHNFISQLPKGYHTLVGDRGTQLSGGQKQRIAIARALVRDPRILLLDEATSALDAESEGVVQHALDKASHGRTTIVIAHRLSTVRNANKIIAIKEGRVVECGTHSELIEKGGLYYDLVNAQTFSDAIDNVAVTEDDNEKPSLHKQTSEVNGPDMELRQRGATVGSLVPVDDDTSKAKAGDLKRLRKELEEEGVRETNLIEILYQAREEWIWLGLGLFSAVFGGFIFPAYAVFFTEILDIFTKPPHTMLTEGHFWALMFLVLAFAQAAAFFGNVYFCGIAAERLTSGLRSRVFKNVVSHEIGYFDSPLHSSGRICTRLATDVPTLKSAIDFRFATVITTVVSILCGVGLAFYYGWKMALVVLGLFPLIAIGQTLRQRLVNGAHSRNASKAIEMSGKVAMEAIEHVRTVQSLTRENTFHRKFCSFLDAPHKEGQRQAIIQGFSYGFASCSLFVLNCCSYRFAMYLIVNDIMLPMVALRVLYCVSITATTLGFASAYFPEYMKARFAGGIIFNMLHDQPVIDSLDRNGEQKKLTGKIEFRNVRFCYPERKEIEILKGLSFEVNVGQSLALVGASGCGKSTVVGLLERFYDVSSGQVLLDGVDIRLLNPAATRAQIALVSQEPTLFDASIAENIAYGLDEVSQQEIEAAAMKANIHQFIVQLPQGYDTNVGNKGTQLSGGQKQRIAIARALVRNPRVLLLDEATSALDTESEKVVQDALDRAREGRTCILIAHRLSTVIGADKIAVVHAGRIVEQGTHSELLALRGAYFELTQKQNSKQ